MTAPALVLDGVTVRFPAAAGGQLRALFRVGFGVEPGRVLALIGESGSGKSTAGRVICRLVAPAEGRLIVDGVDVIAAEPRGPSRGFFGRVQLVFQDPFGSLNPVHTVGHHISRPLLLHAKATAATVRQRVLSLLERCGLRPADAFIDAYPHQLSGGQRQRVAIARALAPGPRVLVADEPTSMLDLSVRADILTLLRQLADEDGLAVVLITHDLAAARLVADDAVVLYGGQVLERGPIQALVETPLHPYTQLLVAAASSSAGGRHAALPARPGHPTVVDPPPGCPFAPRCLSATPKCRAEDPPEVALQGRSARCHHLPAQGAVSLSETPNRSE